MESYELPAIAGSTLDNDQAEILESAIQEAIRGKVRQSDLLVVNLKDVTTIEWTAAQRLARLFDSYLRGVLEHQVAGGTYYLAIRGLLGENAREPLHLAAVRVKVAIVAGQGTDAGEDQRLLRHHTIGTIARIRGSWPTFSLIWNAKNPMAPFEIINVFHTSREKRSVYSDLTKLHSAHLISRNESPPYRYFAIR